MQKTFIIAEAGVNHNGSLTIAKKLVEKAKEAGADCIKFQTFCPEMLVCKSAVRANYQIKNTSSDGSQLQMLKELALDYKQTKILKEFCESQEILFLSSPFDLPSIDFLLELNIKAWKIPSGEITNLPYLEKIGRTKKPVILSTGISNKKEIESAVYILKENGIESIALLHCTSEYPAPYDEINLSAIRTMKEYFQLPVGYSDHTIGIEASVASVALGASIIEKHFTLDKTMRGPDHVASLEPSQFRQMVLEIRNVEKALGNGIKEPSLSELKNRDIVRKSIVARHNIQKGDIFTEENITVKRPGGGINPMRWYDIIGKVSNKDFEEDEMIEL